jgi:hypothetical protein
MFEGGVGSNVKALRKEGNDMAYHEKDCPKSKLVRKSMGWVFALVLGLLVCIADIKLPAETEKGDAPLENLMAGDEAISNFILPNPDEGDISEIDSTPYVPSGEPALVPFDQIIHEAAGRHHVDADLILAVMMVESQLNPTARSKKGARGLMQLMPITADALDVVDIYCPEENVNAGVRHLKWLLDRFDGDLTMALAAYNAGVQNVLRHNGVPPFPETRAYVKRVLEYYAEIKFDSLEF